MDWAIYLLGALVAVGLGYAGGQWAVRTDRRRRATAAPDDPTEAAFRLDHRDGMTWELVNVGQGPGSLVNLVPLQDGIENWPPKAVPGQVETVVSALMPTLEPGDSMSVWFSRYDDRQQVIVSWTSPTNVRMGPVVLDVPTPPEPSRTTLH